LRKRLDDWLVARCGGIRPPADHVVKLFLAGVPRAEVIQSWTVARLNAHLDVDPIDARVKTAPGFHDEPVFSGADLQGVSSVWF